MKYRTTRKCRRLFRHSADSEMRSLIRTTLDKKGIEYTPAEIDEFTQWLIPELWAQFKKYGTAQRDAAYDELSNAKITLPNGTQGKPYRMPSVIILPSTLTSEFTIEGLEEVGLSYSLGDDGCSLSITGTPTKYGKFPLTISCKYPNWKSGDKLLKRVVNIEINPDPRSLWRNIPSSEDIIFPKPDTDKEYVKVEADADGNPQKDIVAASQRGRSHAQDGKPRDDHYQLYHSDETGWYIIAVADGAGSAKYSRKGSELACKSVVKYLQDRLPGNQTFEDAIRRYHAAKDDPAAEASERKKVGDLTYHLLAYAAHDAHKLINETAAKCGEGCRPKDFATTLLLAVCKKFDFGWFIGTFWVGDGALCLYDHDKQTFKLMGIPDEGEFSGQTRFLTMPEIFKDAPALYNRLRFNIYDDFTALMLMTDGVSDPMFGTDANLNNIDKWNELWQTLHDGFPEDNINGVDLTDDNEQAADQLLQWLNFWKAGEHDDRTIAILY